MITVDSRVGAPMGKTRETRMDEWLRDLRRIGVPAEEGHLEFGDFAWTGEYVDERPVRVGLELKTIADLVSSIHSGRLSSHQIPGMTRTYEFRYLLVEGPMRVDIDGLLLQPRGSNSWAPTRPPTTYREVVNYLNSVELLAGMHIRRTWSGLETVNVIANLYRWWQKPWDQHNSLEMSYRVPANAPILMTKPNQVQKVAMTLPGIGYKTAYALARKFHSPAELVQATLDDLSSVPGLGPKTAKKAYDALRRKA